jgi:hypothetical protein
MDDRRDSDELERQTERLGREGQEAAHELKRHGDQLQEQIDEAREDWERKKDDTAVPGATGDALTGSEDQPEPGSDEHRLPDGPG